MLKKLKEKLRILAARYLIKHGWNPLCPIQEGMRKNDSESIDFVRCKIQDDNLSNTQKVNSIRRYFGLSRPVKKGKKYV